MINGNSVVFQLGKESTYGTAISSATERVKISSESLKEVYNKIDEGVAVGGRGSGMVATMGVGVEGSVSTLLRPDMGNFIKGALGVETKTTSTEGTKHTFTAIDNDETKHLPSYTLFVDRKAGKFSYSGCKINTLSLSASAGNYVNCDISFVGKQEATVQSLNDVTPSDLKAFKFAQGKVYFDNVAVADVTSIDLSINNNLDAQVQTTDTGVYYKQPEVGVREITSNVSMLYSSSAETIRSGKYKSDSTFAMKLEFVSDEKIASSEAYKMTITLPCCQMEDANANMGGLETLSQDVSIRVVDNLDDELITIELVNDSSDLY